MQPGLPTARFRGTPRRGTWRQCDHLHQGTNQPRRARPRCPRLPWRLQTRAASDRRPRRPRRARGRHMELCRRRAHSSPSRRPTTSMAAVSNAPDESRPRMHQVCGTSNRPFSSGDARVIGASSPGSPREESDVRGRGQRVERGGRAQPWGRWRFASSDPRRPCPAGICGPASGRMVGPARVRHAGCAARSQRG